LSIAIITGTAVVTYRGVELKLVSWREFGSGAVAMRYEPRK